MLFLSVIECRQDASYRFYQSDELSGWWTFSPNSSPDIDSHLTQFKSPLLMECVDGCGKGGQFAIYGALAGGSDLWDSDL